MDPTLNFQQTVRVQWLQTFALKSCYIFVHFPCCAHRSMMQITMPLRYSQSPCSSTGLGLFDKSPRAASACQDKLKKEKGSKQKGLCPLKKAALRGGIHCRMGQISCYVMISSSSLSANGILLRYQLAIGGVTEAQAAPSATMGGAKTALMGATQNAAQMATWQSSRSSW